MTTSSGSYGPRDDHERVGQHASEEGNGGSEVSRSHRSGGPLGREQAPSAGELYERVRQRLEEHPYQTVAIVAGAGFILGGGLFTRLAGNMIGTALRFGIAGAVAPLLDELASGSGQPEVPGD